MDRNNYKEMLLKKQSDLCLEIAKYSLIIEDQDFYSIEALEKEISNLEQQLRYCQEQSLKDYKKGHKTS